MKKEISTRLAALRKIMRDRGISAAIIPQADPHLSEYMSSHWQARRFLSGFTGSAGDLLITLDKALLWTDSRYFLQAAQQLADTEIILMKDGLPDTPSISGWLVSNLRSGETVGIDAMLFSVSGCQALKMELNAGGLGLVTDFDVIDQIWADRPALPSCEIFVHEQKYTGTPATEKIAATLAEAAKSHATSMFISGLDETAWLLNIRSNDVKYNPVVTAYTFLSPEGSILFTDPVKVTPEVTVYLASQGVKVEPYDKVKEFLTSLPSTARVLVDPARSSAGIVEILGERAVKATSPILMLKACKNDVQLAGTRAAMLRDGVAMVKSLYEITTRVHNGEHTTELDVAAILRKYRSQGAYYFDESFGTIAGYGPHGAIVHYEADEQSSSTLKPEGLLLIDSGAQYLDGTTDITRTIALGTPTADEKLDFTLVMKGHIALASVTFPEGTTGHQLDAIARQFLWARGLSYLHGTGHGVGHFLNVHEGPQSIRLNYVPAALRPGMITSNEPGLYREGIHGIRCENLVLTVEKMTTEFGKFYGFETLTLCPFDRSLFDLSIMTAQEIAWLNQYHHTVAENLMPLIDDQAVKEWLAEATKPLEA